MGSLSDKKKNATISTRQTNRTKKSMSTTAQTYWQSSSEIWEGLCNYSLKNEVDKDAISCFSIQKDWRFAVRAKSFALHWRSRGFFRCHVRSCEKGLFPQPTESLSHLQHLISGGRECLGVGCFEAVHSEVHSSLRKPRTPRFMVYLSTSSLSRGLFRACKVSAAKGIFAAYVHGFFEKDWVV